MLEEFEREGSQIDIRDWKRVPDFATKGNKDGIRTVVVNSCGNPHPTGDGDYSETARQFGIVNTSKD
jgi:hypothetical protein